MESRSKYSAPGIASFVARHGSRLAMMPWYAALAAGAVQAVRRWHADEPEWSYYQRLVLEPLALATGPDEKLFGYLPGAKALLTPFVAAEPVGFFLFLALSIASLHGVFCLLRGLFARLDQPLGAPSLFWLSACLSMPAYLALQNNQLVSFSLCLTLLAMRYLWQRRQTRASYLMAFAILIKTLPVALLVIPTLMGRWKMPLYTVILVGAFSVISASLTDGVPSSLYHHAVWPHQASEQNPLDRLRGDLPRSYGSNQSALAFATSAAIALDTPALAHGVKYFSTFFGLVLACLTFLVHRRADERLYWMTAFCWLAWLAFAAPFARYYYVIYAAPLWFAIPFVVASPLRKWQWALLALFPASSFAMLGHNPVYAICTLLTMLTGTTVLARAVMAASIKASDSAPEWELWQQWRLRRLAWVGVPLALVAMGAWWSARSYATYLNDFAMMMIDEEPMGEADAILVMASQDTFEQSMLPPQAMLVGEESPSLVENLRDADSRDLYIVSFRHLWEIESLDSEGKLERLQANRGFVLYGERD